MKAKRIFTFFLLGLSCTQKMDIFNSILKINDGNYIIVGTTESFGAKFSDGLVIKVDLSGNEIWKRIFDGNGTENFSDIVLTDDEGYLILGTTNPFGAGNPFSAGKSDGWLVKLDKRGNKIWSRTYGGKKNEFIVSLEKANDGCYVLAGGTESYGSGKRDFYLIKVDATGNELWSRTFGGNKIEGANDVKQTKDGGYILVGSTKSFGVGDRDFFMIKTDAQGHKLWSRTFGGKKCERAFSVHENDEGGYTLTGVTSSFGAGEYDGWLIITDEKGNRIQAHTYGGEKNDLIRFSKKTAEGGYMLIGIKSIFNNKAGDLWLVKTDIQGAQIWEKTYSGEARGFHHPWYKPIGGELRDEGSCVIQTIDNGYLLTGVNSGPILPTYCSGDAWLIKVDSEGNKQWDKIFGE